MKLVVNWYLLLAVNGISARLCGFPGKPTNGDFAPRKQFYEQGEHVTYTCNNGYYSKVENRDVNEDKRFCQSHGVWNGTVPTYFYDSVDKKYLMASFRSENLQRISDEDDNTCARLYFSDNEEETDITADLRLTSNTTSVTMILGNIENDPRKITATVKIKQRGTYRHYWQDCEVPKPMSSHMSLNFVCDGIRNSATQLKIVFGPTDPLLNNAKISVCTLRATAITTTTCGEPEIPFHGDVGKKSESSRTDTAQYKCLDGYVLLGDESSSCIRKGTAYLWQSSKPPICISEGDRDCRVLPEIQNGHLIISMPDCEEDYSFKDLHNTAALQCDPGYTLQSPKQMDYCNELTNWTWSFDCKSPINSTECVLTMKQGTNLTWMNAFVGVGTAAGIMVIIFIVWCYKSSKSPNKTFFISRTNYMAEQNQRERNPRDTLVTAHADEHVYEEVVLSENFTKQTGNQPDNGHRVDEFGYEIPRKLHM